MRLWLLIIALISASCIHAQQVYPSSKRVSNFPLGSCGASGTTAEKDGELNAANSPYSIKWEDDYCVSISDKPEGCTQAPNKAGCEYWKTNLRKIVFPMGWSDCLTPAQNGKLGGPSGMATLDIGPVTITENNVPGAPVVTVGYFRIFRHTAAYQYEMVSASPFMNAAFKSKFPNKTSLDGMKMCYPKSGGVYSLPAGSTPLSCTKFNDQNKANNNFGELNKTSTAVGLYDPGSHSYCPVFFALRPGGVPPPTVVPTVVPPTVEPTVVPTATPTVVPPTVVPTVIPTVVPTATPTGSVSFRVIPAQAVYKYTTRTIWSSVGVWVSADGDPAYNVPTNYKVFTESGSTFRDLSRNTDDKGYVKFGLPIDKNSKPGKYKIVVKSTIDGKIYTSNPVYFTIE